MPTGLPRLLILAIAFLGLAVVLFMVTAERPGLPEPCVNGISALEGNDYDTAIDSFIACIETGELEDPVLANVYDALGSASYAKGKYLQAVDDFSLAIELDPEHGWAHNNRCWTYGLLQRPEDALADCNVALRKLPNQPEVLDSRAFAYWQLGELDKARVDLERARKIDATLPTPEERFKEFEELL